MNRLGVLVVCAWGCVQGVPIEGAPCPCPTGFVCKDDSFCVPGSVPRSDGALEPAVDAVSPSGEAGDHACDAAECQASLLAQAGLAAELGDVAVDSSGLYLTEHSSPGRVLRIALDGSGAVTVLASGQPKPEGMAVDDTHVYWVNWADGAPRVSAAAVMRVPKAGGIMPTILAPNQMGPRGVAVDATHVYWTVWATGEIKRLLKGGGGSPETVAMAEMNPRDVAVDATHVYWGNFGSGDQKIKRTSKAGGPAPTPTVLAAAGGSPVDLTLNETRVYWISYGDRRLWSVSKDGGMPTLIADQAGPPTGGHGLGLDGAHVYWTNSREILRAPEAGGSATVLFQGNAIGGLAVDGRGIYFSVGPNLMRLPKGR